MLQLKHNDYKVGWICALPKEQTAAMAMLDARHANLPKPPTDPNAYTLGAIGDHNIVIACLPKGKYGTVSASVVASNMASTFPAIRFGLMVGIGGGIPPNVRLGDVVVSVPVDQSPGVVQWDLGKAEEGGAFRRTGLLNNPPTSLLTVLTQLESEHEMMGPGFPQYLEELATKFPRLASKYAKSNQLEDILFDKDYPHASCTDDTGQDDSCASCDKSRSVKQEPRDAQVHYGLIASGNQVIKDAMFRESLVKELGGRVLCVEMEAAGLMDNFPCIVIRGICDYADSHKNKAWQEHAAAVAAAFTKELLGYVTVAAVTEEKSAKDILSHSKSTPRSRVDLDDAYHTFSVHS
jgi:nucleoside phosphorylase